MAKIKFYKQLIRKHKKRTGRSRGQITVRYRGGGHKRKYRIIDFKRPLEIVGKIETIEYDPNRSALIARVCYDNGERRYIIAPHSLKIGDKIIASEKASVKTGNRLKLKNIPAGTWIYEIETNINQGGILVRSAGTYAQLMAKEGKYAQIILPSKEIRLVPIEGFATIGQISNPQLNTQKLRKAGQSRWRGIKPQVRGSAMNPVDHPHGGGEGRTSIGLKYPKTPWGKHALGKKTRKRKYTNRFIVKRRIRNKKIS